MNEGFGKGLPIEMAADDQKPFGDSAACTGIAGSLDRIFVAEFVQSLFVAA